MSEAAPPPTFLVVACEASADLHGARVVDAVRRQHPAARFVGIGGDACAERGVELLAHARELGIMGFTDALAALPRVWRIMRRVHRTARQAGVAAALLIDAPDFNLRLARRLWRLRVPVVYFISPKLWATRAGRAALVRRYVRRMLVIFPFEVEFYAARGVRAEYVGNPVVEQMVDASGRQQARASLGVTDGERVVAMLPGSRRGEIARIAPDLGSAAAALRAGEGVRVLVPRAPTVDRAQLEAALGPGAPVEILDGRAREALAAADVAVVAAGTATLEAALVDVPTVMVYRVSAISALIYRLLLKIPYISLINIIAQRFVIKELWQRQLSPAAVVAEVRRLLRGEGREELRRAYAEIRAQLGQHDTAARVAAVLLEEGDLGRDRAARP